jgi:hypothetical protein
MKTAFSVDAWICDCRSACDDPVQLISDLESSPTTGIVPDRRVTDYQDDPRTPEFQETICALVAMGEEPQPHHASGWATARVMESFHGINRLFNRRPILHSLHAWEAWQGECTFDDRSACPLVLSGAFAECWPDGLFRVVISTAHHL